MQLNWERRFCSDEKSLGEFRNSLSGAALQARRLLAFVYCKHQFQTNKERHNAPFKVKTGRMTLGFAIQTVEKAQGRKGKSNNEEIYFTLKNKFKLYFNHNKENRH
jgi:hypothetical protein